MKFGMEKFALMSQKKKDPYIDAFKADSEAYKQKVRDFYQKHPDLLKNKRKRIRAFSSSAFYSPFVYYYEHLNKNTGKSFTRPVAQKMWKELSDKEKGHYITELANLVTDKTVKIAKSEQKLMGELLKWSNWYDNH